MVNNKDSSTTTTLSLSGAPKTMKIIRGSESERSMLAGRANFCYRDLSSLMQEGETRRMNQSVKKGNK